MTIFPLPRRPNLNVFQASGVAFLIRTTKIKFAIQSQVQVLMRPCPRLLELGKLHCSGSNKCIVSEPPEWGCSGADSFPPRASRSLLLAPLNQILVCIFHASAFGSVRKSALKMLCCGFYVLCCYVQDRAIFMSALSVSSCVVLWEGGLKI